VRVIDRAHLPELTRFPCLGEEASQEQPRPAAISRMRSSQRGDVHSRGGAGGSSGRRGGSDRSTSSSADTFLVSRRSSIGRTDPTRRRIAYALVSNG
jgi:hypothetical protein